mgnify:CR=1 FL=1
MFLDTAGPPNRLVPVMSSALSVGFCALAFGTLGAFVPERPGVPVYDFLNLSGPAATCGLFKVAMLPALVAPAVACSLTITSFIFIVGIYNFWEMVQPDNVSV